MPVAPVTAMIKQAEGEFKPLDLEARVRDYWARTKSYSRTKKHRASGKEFYFCDGPPYTTGSIHLGTAMNKVVKDTVVRYTRMHDRNVRDQPGWDMHGLPIEVQVEKLLGIANKKEIESLGIEKFVERCRAHAQELRGRMTEQFIGLGVWMDWEHPYMTITNTYMEAAWWTLKRAHERGYLVEAHRSVNWCPRCETALAEAEIEYEDVDDPSVFVKFPLRGRPHESLLVWTTTPWTLPANLAVAVHPQYEYGKVRVVREGKAEFLWVLMERVPDLMKEAGVTEYEVVDTAVGHSMLGWEYEHPFREQVPHQASVQGQWIHKVLGAETVAKEDTGLVHIAPGHGPDDFEIGLRHGIAAFCPVDERGRYTDEAGTYAGKAIREANPEIVGFLQDRGLLFRHTTARHRYGHCWRCRTPILFRTTRQWFVKVSELKDTMVREIQRVRWTPDWAGAARQMEWTQNLRDWCVSRQRYWGTPLPVWRCESCREIKVVGSTRELAEGKNYVAGMDFHRPWIDQVTFGCTKCGATMRRVPDVLDVWFDSGVCIWAQLVESGELDRWWPADWITEAGDQTRGWFSAQLAAGAVAFDSSPFESVLLHGWMNGPDGLPMSKSKGNNIDPAEVIAKHGVDAFRLYLLRVNAPWEDINFQWDEVKNTQRTLNILWNVYRFATTYLGMDRFDPQAFSVDALVRFMKPEDKWMLSRTERLKSSVDAEMQGYNLHRAARLIEEFIVDDLSRFYIKLIRDRTWKEGEDRGKLAAYKVLHEALLTAVKTLAPFCPHITEEIYQNLDGRLLTVHMADWPVANPSWMSAELETGMAQVRDLSTHLLRLRQKFNLKLRWPIREVALRGAPESLNRALSTFRDAFLESANVGDLVLVGSDQEFGGMDFRLRPNPEAISRVYKTWWTRIITLLENRPPLEVKRALEKGEFRLGIEGQVIKIEPHMVVFERKVPEGVHVELGSYGELFVDTRVTPEIEAEGYAREIIRRIQQMRKELNLEVQDFVRAAVKARKEVSATLEPWREVVTRETRSRSLTIGEQAVSEEYVVDWPVDGETFTIGVTPYHMGAALRDFTPINGLDERKAIQLFDAGFTTLAALEMASAKELVTVAGLSEDDARRVREHFTSGEKGQAPCPVCGASLAPGVRRCMRCLEHPREKSCPHCGAGLWEDQQSCDLCGKSFAVSTAPPPLAPAVVLVTPVALPVAVPEVPVVQPPAEPAPSLPAVPEPVPVPVVPGASEPPPEAAIRPAPPVHDTPTPSSAPMPAEEAPEHLRESSSYMVIEARTEKALELFAREVRNGRRGFCVSRTFPEKIRERFPELKGVPIVWLSNVGKDDTIRPKDLEKLSLSLEQFMAQEGGTILLDGIEYLITNNNFITVLRLVQSLRDQIAINRAILVMPVNPLTLDQNQRSLLEREVDHILKGAG